MAALYQSLTSNLIQVNVAFGAFFFVCTRDIMNPSPDPNLESDFGPSFSYDSNYVFLDLESALDSVSYSSSQ